MDEEHIGIDEDDEELRRTESQCQIGETQG
jgi:hypothetical protein